MRKAGKLFIGALSVGALVGTGYAAWTVNYGGATKVDKEVNPVFDTELVINGAGLVVTDKETELNFTEEADADFEISYYVSPSNTNWYDHIYADDAAVDINVTVSGVNNKADDSWKEYIVAPTAEIGYEDWLGADAKAAGKYEVSLTFAWNEAKPSERWASLTPAEQEVNYRAMLEAVAGLKFVVTFELYSMPRVVTSVTLDKQLLELSDRDNKTGKLVATVLPEKAADKSLTWSSENEQVATVDQEGNVTAVGVGETVIKATSVNNIVASATVKVTHDVLPVTFSASGDVDNVIITAMYVHDEDGTGLIDLEANNLNHLIGKEIALMVMPKDGYVLDSVKVKATRDQAVYEKNVELTEVTQGSGVLGARYDFTVEEGFAHEVIVAAHEIPAHGTVVTDPLSVSEAVEIATKQGSTATDNDYYVAGTIKSVSGLSNGMLRFVYVEDDAGNEFEFYNLKNVNGTDFTAVTDLAAGDKVVGVGKIKQYNTTSEFDGCTLVSLEKLKVNVQVTANEGVTIEGTIPATMERYSSVDLTITVPEGKELSIEGNGLSKKEGNVFTLTAGVTDINITLTATEPSTANTYSKASSIANGDTVVFICESNHAILNGFSTGKTPYGNGEKDKISFNADNKLVEFDGIYTFTVVANEDSTYSFMNSENKYLYWSSGNSATVNASINANSSWTVTFEENTGNAIIINSADSARKLQYNASNPRFAAYTSSQTPIQLYKLD